MQYNFDLYMLYWPKNKMGKLTKNLETEIELGFLIICCSLAVLFTGVTKDQIASLHRLWQIPEQSTLIKSVLQMWVQMYMIRSSDIDLDSDERLFKCTLKLD